MFGEIAVKARDAASMFWQALDDHEKRYLIFAACYVALTAYSALATTMKQRQRDALKAEILEEIHAR